MRHVEIDEAGAEVVARLLATGQYGSEADIVSLSVRVLDEQLSRFRREVEAGMSDYRSGRFSGRAVKDIIQSAQARFESQSPR